LSSKPTPKDKRDKTKMYHRKGGHLQKQKNIASLENEVSMRVSIVNMPQEAT
jgi:hypothetical protein